MLVRAFGCLLCLTTSWDDFVVCGEQQTTSAIHPETSRRLCRERQVRPIQCCFRTLSRRMSITSFSLQSFVSTLMTAIRFPKRLHDFRSRTPWLCIRSCSDEQSIFFVALQPQIAGQAVFLHPVLKRERDSPRSRDRSGSYRSWGDWHNC